MERRSLVVVRCGDQSLHHAWVGDNRNWDLAVSYFGANANATFENAEFVHRFRGGKWDGIYDFFAQHPEVLQQYQYFWLPDDDIATDCQNINIMFDYMQHEGFELAQPSLSAPSFLSHITCAWNPLFEHRNVNLVEIMIPILDARMMTLVLPLFKHTKSGFGIDFVWNRFTSDPQSKVAIIDRVQVTHTRAVGGALKKMMDATSSQTAEQEQDRFLLPYGDVIKTEMVMGGRLRIGAVIRNKAVAASLAAIGWLLTPVGRRGFTQTISPLRFIVWVARNWSGTLAETRQHTPIRPYPPHLG